MTVLVETHIIYQIIAGIGGRRYIGKTVNFPRRMAQHMNELARGVHKNKSLQEAYKEIGETAFLFSILGRFESDKEASIFEAHEIKKAGILAHNVHMNEAKKTQIIDDIKIEIPLELDFEEFHQKFEHFCKTNNLTDSVIGQSLTPPVTGACIWGWRKGRSEPARIYRRQIINFGNGYFTAEDFI